MTNPSDGRSGKFGSAQVPRWQLWVAFVVLSTATQIAFKWAGMRLEGLPYGFYWGFVALTTPAVYIAVTGYVALFVLWMTILQRTDLTRAFAMTGLIYVTVPAVGWLMFGEQFGLVRVIGIVLIIAGVMMMGRE